MNNFILRKTILILFIIMAFSLVNSQELVYRTYISFDYDLGEINSIKLIPGEPTEFVESDFKIVLLDEGRKTIREYGLVVSTNLTGQAEEAENFSKIINIPYNENTAFIQLLYGKKVIFGERVSLCYINEFCDEYESVYSCPSDCKPDEKDGYCNKETDNICDPDCAKGTDYDCIKKDYTENLVSNATYERKPIIETDPDELVETQEAFPIIFPVAIVLGIIVSGIMIWRMKKISNQK